MVLLAGAGAVAGCSRDGGMPKRTFALKYLSAEDAGLLVRDYVPPEGAIQLRGDSGKAGVITVSAPSSRLDQIAQIIAKFDAPAPDAHLFFQVIEADGFTTKDPEIADVEAALRDVFKFTGYRLVASAAINSRSPGSFEQWVGGTYVLQGQISAPKRPGAVNLDISLGTRNLPMLTTSVTIPDGQVVVVGSSRPDASKPTLILVVRTKNE
jgi:type II secretory pathway component GspD/PulD (secretin)